MTAIALLSTLNEMHWFPSLCFTFIFFLLGLCPKKLAWLAFELHQKHHITIIRNVSLPKARHPELSSHAYIFYFSRQSETQRFDGSSGELPSIKSLLSRSNVQVMLMKRIENQNEECFIYHKASNTFIAGKTHMQSIVYLPVLDQKAFIYFECIKSLLTYPLVHLCESSQFFFFFCI